MTRPSPSPSTTDAVDIEPALPGRTIMRQRWLDVSFAHWDVDPIAIQRLLPTGVDVDTFDGRAWVSLVGFEMKDLRLIGMPMIPSTGSFSEFNVRTYVTGRHGPGVWFFSLDTTNWLPTLTARAAFALPYCVGDIEVSHRPDRHTWRVARRWPDRAVGSLEIAVGDPLDAPDELDRFLTDRWRLYARTRLNGRLLSAPIHHEPWPLHRGDLVDADLGLAPHALRSIDAETVVHHASGVSVTVGRPRWA